jgi:hypothetical protein
LEEVDHIANVALDVPSVSIDFFATTFLEIAIPDRPVVSRTGLSASSIST